MGSLIQGNHGAYCTNGGYGADLLRAGLRSLSMPGLEGLSANYRAQLVVTCARLIRPSRT